MLIVWFVICGINVYCVTLLQMWIRSIIKYEIINYFLNQSGQQLWFDQIVFNYKIVFDFRKSVIILILKKYRNEINCLFIIFKKYIY